MQVFTRVFRCVSLVVVAAAGGCAAPPAEDEQLKLIHQYEACVGDSTTQSGDFAHDPFRCDPIRDLLQAMKRRRPPASHPESQQQVAAPAINQIMERAMAAQEAGQDQQAEQDYTRILQQDPDNAQALRNRGIARAAQGRHDEAIADYDRALQLAPGDAEAQIGRGNSEAAQGHLGEAAQDYDRAIQRDPNSAAARHNRAVIEHGLPVDRTLQAAMPNAPGDPGAAQRARGDSLFDQSKYGEAITAYDDALARNAGDGAALRGRGAAKALQGDIKGGLGDLTAALQQNPNDIEALLNRARLQELQGNRDAAIADLRRASQIDPSDKDVAEAMRRMGISR